MKICDHAVEELWGQYFATRTHLCRNRLVEHYSPLVKLQASRLSRRLPRHVRFEEICSAGYEGLMHAVEAFDPARQARFETFCQRRIVGSVIDWLRSLDMQSRSIRDFGKLRRATHDRLSDQLNRPAQDDEVAAGMGMPMGRYADLNRALTAGQQVQASAMDAQLQRQGSGEPSSRGWDVCDPRQTDPSSGIARDMLVDLLTRGLTRNERHVLLLYYFEDMTMSEIGLILSLSESRICQIHQEVLGRLRRATRQYLHQEDLAA